MIFVGILAMIIGIVLMIIDKVADTGLIWLIGFIVMLVGIVILGWNIKVFFWRSIVH